jgi:predicted Fe-Mo cluster-binding NifX family protein
MLAIPIDTENSTTLSKLYGKAPFFALLDTSTGDFTVIKNEVEGKGPKSGDFLKSKGATSTIFYYMGEGVYKSFDKNGMDVYTADYNEYPINEIYTKMKKDEFVKLDSTNFDKLLNPGEGEVCTCGCESKK